MLNKVKLANGTEVSWEEFSKWSSHKQYMNLFPPSLGRQVTEEERKNRSKAQKLRHINKPASEETRRKISAKNLNRKMTSEQRNNMKQGWKALKENGWISPKKGQYNKALWKPIMTPNGLFPSMILLAERVHNDLSLSSIAYAKAKIHYWLKKYPKHYYYIIDNSNDD